jgi:hypothetical protein
MASYKLRLNVEYEGKKFVVVLTDPKATFQTLKETVIKKLAIPKQISEISVENDKGFAVDTDLNEEVNNLLEDKDLIFVKSKGSPPQNPLQTAPIQAPVVQPPIIIPPIPKEEKKAKTRSNLGITLRKMPLTMS